MKEKEWESVLLKHQISWKTFYFKTKELEDWISGAQSTVLEINDDLGYLMNKHKVGCFFTDRVWNALGLE